MPILAVIKGIKVYLYYDDHEPPHFHAECGEFEVVVEISTLNVIRGRFPKSDVGELLRWASSRQSEIMEQWNRARQAKPIERIDRKAK
jgi:Domain of unknown function (DUF4160)